jgi:nucleotide-binding universal stress UspA family protein
MMHLKNILLPTDLSQRSKRALRYALSLAMEYSAAITVLYVANDLDHWELYSDESSFISPVQRAWPADRVLAEATLELSNFLAPYSDTIKRVPALSKRVALGPIVDEIVNAAEDVTADLIVMSPRRLRGVSRILTPSITDRVMRISPCPVLTVIDPLPSRPWQGKLTTRLFGWPRPRFAGV